MSPMTEYVGVHMESRYECPCGATIIRLYELIGAASDEGQCSMVNQILPPPLQQEKHFRHMRLYTIIFDFEVAYPFPL